MAGLATFYPGRGGKTTTETHAGKPGGFILDNRDQIGKVLALPACCRQKFRPAQ
jgi:hypothetical protein